MIHSIMQLYFGISYGSFNAVDLLGKTAPSYIYNDDNSMKIEDDFFFEFQAKFVFT